MNWLHLFSALAICNLSEPPSLTVQYLFVIRTYTVLSDCVEVHVLSAVKASAQMVFSFTLAVKLLYLGPRGKVTPFDTVASEGATSLVMF